jgi:hypothetical protein
VDVTVTTAWVALSRVTVVGADDTGEKLASPALVAVTVQVPALVLVNVAPESEQPEAVPSRARNDTAPVPDPPLVVSASGVSYVPVVEVTVRAACGGSALIVTAVAVEDTAL